MYGKTVELRAILYLLQHFIIHFEYAYRKICLLFNRNVFFNRKRINHIGENNRYSLQSFKQTGKQRKTRPTMSVCPLLLRLVGGHKYLCA